MPSDLASFGICGHAAAMGGPSWAVYKSGESLFGVIIVLIVACPACASCTLESVTIILPSTSIISMTEDKASG